MPPLTDEQRVGLRQAYDIESYQFKMSFTVTQDLYWEMLMFCEIIKRDLLVKVYHMDNEHSTLVFDHMGKLKNVRSANLLTPVHVFSWMREYWLVFPFYSGRPWSNIIVTKKTKGIREEGLLARILMDVLEGLETLHSEKLCHRNIAPYSLYLDKDSGRTLLTGFLSVKFFEKEDEERPGISMWKGDRAYLLPPEMRKIFFEESSPEMKKETETTIDQTKADIFMFGITAMNLLVGAPPPRVKTPERWRQPSLQDYKVVPEGLSKDLVDLINNCLTWSTRKRPTVSQLKAMPFFKRMATHKDVLEKIGSLVEPQLGREMSRADLPPSMRDDDPLRDGGERSSHGHSWDFDDTRVLSHQNVTIRPNSSRDLGTIEEKGPVTTLPRDSREDRLPQYKPEHPSELLEPPSGGAADPSVKPSALGLGKSHGKQAPPRANPGPPNDGPSSPFMAQHPKPKSRFDVLTPTHDMHEGANVPPVFLSQPGYGGVPTGPAPVTGPVVPHRTGMDVDDTSQHSSAGGTFSERSTPRNPQPSTAVETVRGRFAIGSVEETQTIENGGRRSPSNNFAPPSNVPPRSDPAPPSEPVISITAMSVDQVMHWVRRIGEAYESYAEDFRKHAIDGDMLATMTDEDLKDIGVGKGVHRKKILQMVKRLRTSTSDKV